jgi:hypothetical protein
LITYPPVEDLIAQIKETSFVQVGKNLMKQGVDIKNIK